MSTNIWEKDHAAVQDTSSSMAIISKFVANAAGEAITMQWSVTLKSSLLAVADTIMALLEANDIACVLKSDEHEWVGVDAGNRCFVIVAYDRRSNYNEFEGPSYEQKSNLLARKIQVFTLTAVGNREILEMLQNGLNKVCHSERYAQVKWWYLGKHGPSYQVTYLDKPKAVILPEFYPDIDLNKYMDAYLNSDASVLLMAGEPGTGKTTLLRDTIFSKNLSASVVYDEQLMKKDEVFQDFLFNRDDDMLVIEDADTVLNDRAMDGNKLMSRFLSISDGLIKLPRKKLVFTTNLTDFGRVDQALMRPGRCFDVLVTRKLQYPEALAAARAAGLPLPIKEQAYSLAELFNQGQRREQRRVGFGIG